MSDCNPEEITADVLSIINEDFESYIWKDPEVPYPLTDRELNKRVDWILFGSHAKPFSRGDALTLLVHSYADAYARAREKALIEYVLSNPTGEQTMTLEEMASTPDQTWRDEVIQYFFNTESLRFNLTRKLEELNK